MISCPRHAVNEWRRRFLAFPQAKSIIKKKLGQRNIIWNVAIGEFWGPLRRIEYHFGR
jgi:hypothetical protein